MREQILAALLVIAATLVVSGVALVSIPTALIVGGLLLAALAWLLLGEVGE